MKICELIDRLVKLRAADSEIFVSLKPGEPIMKIDEVWQLRRWASDPGVIVIQAGVPTESAFK